MSQVQIDQLPDINQLWLLESLGLPSSADARIDEVILKIEQTLGERKFAEQARWFLLSVLRHSDNASWETPDDSGLTHETQLELAAALLASLPVRNSLASVLSNRRARYRLLRFASQANRRNCLCSTTSKAYGAALALLDSVKVRKSGHDREPAANEPPAVQPIAMRRAERRIAALNAELTRTPLAIGQTLPKPVMSLSDYDKLEQAILTPVDRRQLRRATARTREDKLSLLLGAVTGGVIFLLVWWFIVD